MNLTIENLWLLYKAYIKYYVVRNDKLIETMFHSFVGSILTYKGYKYLEAGDKLCSTRCHLFTIQDSGTGKSLLMNTNNDLLKYIGIKTKKTVGFNEASMVGSVFEYQGAIKRKKGLFGKLLTLFVDEGSELFSDSNHMKGLRAQLQNMMDEPGKVSKDMKLGTIEYPSRCTLITGSYLFAEFMKTMIETGLLQRMTLTYQEFTQDEKEAMWVEIELLKLKQKSQRLVNAREAIRVFVDNIPPYEIVDPKANPELIHDKSVKRSEVYLKSDILFSRKYVYAAIRNKKKMNLEVVREQFVGPKQQIFETYFNRSHLITDKIAVQHAILNGSKDFRRKIVVREEDLEYALKTTKYHLESVRKLFDVFENTKKFKVVDNAEIIKIISKTPGISQVLLLKELKNSASRGKWAAGQSRSIKIIDNMVEVTGELVIKRGHSNSKKFYLK